VTGMYGGSTAQRHARWRAHAPRTGPITELIRQRLAAGAARDAAVAAAAHADERSRAPSVALSACTTAAALGRGGATTRRRTATAAGSAAGRRCPPRTAPAAVRAAALTRKCIAAFFFGAKPAQLNKPEPWQIYLGGEEEAGGEGSCRCSGGSGKHR